MGGGYKRCNNPINLRADEVSIRRLRLARFTKFWREFQSSLFSPMPTMLSEKQRFIFSYNTFPSICFRNRNAFCAWNLGQSLFSYLWLIQNCKQNAASISALFFKCSFLLFLSPVVLLHPLSIFCFKFSYASLLCFYILMYQSSVFHLPLFSTFSPFSGYPIDAQSSVSLAAIHI